MQWKLEPLFEQLNELNSKVRNAKEADARERETLGLTGDLFDDSHSSAKSLPENVHGLDALLQEDEEARGDVTSENFDVDFCDSFDFGDSVDTGF